VVTSFIDLHVHPPAQEFLGGPLAPYLEGLLAAGRVPGADVAPEQIAAYYRDLGARAVVLGWDAESATGRYPFSSKRVAALVRAAPDVLWGMGAVDPSKGAAAVAQVHEASRLGLSGIALHPSAQGRSPDDRTAFPVWEAAAGHDLVAAFHTGYPMLGTAMPGGAGMRLEPAHPMAVDVVAARLPELRIVLLHGGTLWLAEALAVALHKANVYLCLGGQNPDELTADLLDALAGPLAERVVFGSGFPFARPESWIDKWGRLGMPADLTERLLGANAARLLAALPPSAP
jgi:predicted TIM-barrel fold metal-dependent hydrolase